MIASERFWESTRGRVVALLRRAEQTVGDLAHRLGLTHNAVRAHLMTLERDGLVRQSGQRKSTRRPNHAYQLTPEADRLFPNAYAPVLAEMLRAAREKLPPETQDALLTEAGARLAAPYRQELAGMPFAERVSRVCQLLGAMGADVEVLHRNGVTVLQGNNCPLSVAIRDESDNAGCVVMQRMLAALLGVPVEESCQRGERSRCCFMVETAS